jgi:inhibitor of cysteine peptidase
MKPLAAAILFLFLTGFVAARSATTNTITEASDGKEIKAAVGQILVVELPSNRTTGYGWSQPATTDTVLERLGEPDFVRDTAPSGMVGTSGKDVFRYRAAKAGQETLRLEYARPWEKNAAPAKVVTFNVVVSER